MAHSQSSDKQTPPEDTAAFASEIRGDIDRLKADIGELARTVSAFGKSRVDDLKTRADMSSEEFLESARDTLAEMRRELDKVETKVESQVREKPVQSVLIALGLGFLIAQIMKR